MSKKQEKETVDKSKKFYALYEEFFKACLAEGFVPKPVIMTTQEGIYPRISFVIVNEDEKKELEKSINKIEIAK